MDIMTGAGLVFGTVVIATLMLLGGDLNIFVSDHAAIIIFGGSTAATMIRFPLKVMLHGIPLGAKFAFTMSRLSAVAALFAGPCLGTPLVDRAKASRYSGNARMDDHSRSILPSSVRSAGQ